MSPRFTIRGWMIACVLVGLVLTRVDEWHSQDGRQYLTFTVTSDVQYGVVFHKHGVSVLKYWVGAGDSRPRCVSSIWQFHHKYQ